MTQRVLTTGLVLILSGLLIGPVRSPVSSAQPAATVTSLLPRVYLPLTACSGGCGQDRPIWAHAAAPAAHEVVLFRRPFSLDETLDDVELVIWADTRYEAWLDGVWVGRGPARFSLQTREYDLLPLGQLSPGDHLLAVLVQWAPNNRRSESSQPALKAHLQGVGAAGLRVAVTTDALWKAQSSTAWRQDAAPVHAWDLIGPTELLDLRQLPADWMQPGFADTAWPAAVERDTTQPTTGPRSIPLLVSVPLTSTTIDAGALSPGRAVIELSPPLSDPYPLSLQALEATVLTVEMLSGLETEPQATVRLDGGLLSWADAGAARPDVVIATASLDPGGHILAFSGLPDNGLTVGLSTQGISYASLPFEQGRHAGRRLLLAEPIRQPGRVVISEGAGLNIEFPTLPAYVVLDLGRVIHGRLTADVTGPAGSIVDVGWDERLWQGVRPLPFPGSLHAEWNQVDSWVLDGARRAITTLDARAGRYVLIAVWGEATVHLENVQVWEERYPVARRGAFSSASERLNDIWQVGVDTLYPNMTDAYTDTPWRERGQWWGDAYVEDHINRVAFGDAQLLRRGLWLMAEAFENGRPNALAPNGDGNHMLDFGMLWLQSLYDYWQRTGDTPLLSQVYPSLQDLMAYLAGYEHPATGLLDIPYGHWSQTVLIDWAGESSRYGQSTAVNALYYRTLLDAAAIAAASGRSQDAALWGQKALAIRQQANALLYRVAERRYAASFFQGQYSSPSPHAQAWALACGLSPEGEVSAVADALLELLSPDPAAPNVEVYGMFWVLKALGEAGRISAALEIIERHYGYMLDLGATTWWEGFDVHTNYAASLSHGWGGAPTWFLTHYLLGARRSGANDWRIEPAFDVGGAAAGVLPLQNGDLVLSWERPACQDGRLELTSPTGAQGQALVRRVGDSAVLTLNGQVIWQNGSALTDDVVMTPEGIRVTLGEGSFVLEVHQECDETFLPLVNR